jgi:hypothetical protein
MGNALGLRSLTRNVPKPPQGVSGTTTLDFEERDKNNARHPHAVKVTHATRSHTTGQ